MLKKILIVFYNESNHDYHFIIKKLVENFKKQFTCLEENAEKCITFTVTTKKEDIGIDKNRGEIAKNVYVTYYNLLILQDLWQAHYQILSIIFLKEFIELNVNLDTKIKNVKHVKLNILSIATVFLNT